MNNQEFLEKLEEEGGLEELSYFGISPSELEDSELRKLWKQYIKKHKDLQGLGDKIMEYIENERID